MKELGDVRARLTTREADNVRLEGLVDRITEEKKRLVQRANKLTANGESGAVGAELNDC